MNKTAGLDALKNQILAQLDAYNKAKAGPEGVSATHLPSDVIFAKLLEGFKLGVLAGILGAAGGGALGSLIGAPEVMAGHGASLGILGGTIKGQTDVDKKRLLEQGYEARYPNVFKYLIGNPALNYPISAAVPDSGHLLVKRI